MNESREKQIPPQIIYQDVEEVINKVRAKLEQLYNNDEYKKSFLANIQNSTEPGHLDCYRFCALVGRFPASFYNGDRSKVVSSSTVTLSETTLDGKYSQKIHDLRDQLLDFVVSNKTQLLLQARKELGL